MQWRSLLILLGYVCHPPVWGSQEPCPLLVAGKVDFLREWGAQILRVDDPLYTQQAYVDGIRDAARFATISQYEYPHPFRTPGTGLKRAFDDAFHDDTTDMNASYVLRFTNSGTEANNALYEYAEWAHLRRTGRRPRRVNLLYFGPCYGGTFGRIAEISSRYRVDPGIQKSLQIPTPRVFPGGVLTEAQAERLNALEDEAIAFIRKQAADPTLEIGGIFIEPFPAFDGVYRFSTRFMARLRKVADELRLPIFADEILTGGGRTGKYWSFLHYGGHEVFQPDLFTFGKGLGISGVAAIHRTEEVSDLLQDIWPWPRFGVAMASREGYSYPVTVLDNTSQVPPLVLVHATHILQNIHRRRLAENAERVGAHLLARVRTRFAQRGLDPSQVRGMGLLLWVGPDTDRLFETPVRSYQGRWTPPLTLTIEEADRLLFEPPR